MEEGLGVMRKSLTGIICSFLMMSAAAIAQSDRGTITGTISDPGGAVVASASIQANQLDTGAMFNTTSTETGNYTLAQLPVGRYDIVVKVPGFKTFVRNGLVVQVAQTYRVDVTLEVGGTSESVTVTENASLLKTESGELSSNVTTQRLEDLPVLSIGAAASSAGLRNPYASMQLVPGAYWSANSAVRVAAHPVIPNRCEWKGRIRTMVSSRTPPTRRNQAWTPSKRSRFRPVTIRLNTDRPAVAF